MATLSLQYFYCVRYIILWCRVTVHVNDPVVRSKYCEFSTVGILYTRISMSAKLTILSTKRDGFIIGANVDEFYFF